MNSLIVSQNKIVSNRLDIKCKLEHGTIKLEHVRTLGKVLGAISWFFGFATQLPDGRYVTKSSFMNAFFDYKLDRDAEHLFCEIEYKRAYPHIVREIKNAKISLRNGISVEVIQKMWDSIKDKDFSRYVTKNLWD